jgi:phage/plasmid-like protein (TIGR03299 family)
MAHALTLNAATGKYEMAYVGDTPWHGLGDKLEAGAPIGKWLKAAGMDWKVERAPVQFMEQTWDKQHVMYRSDNKTPLGIVGSEYRIVQPAEVLEFFKDLTEEYGYVLETAGTMYDGRRYWALARTGQTLTLPGNDIIGGYLLLATSADGTMATTAKPTTVRVVCNNTLQMSLRGKGAAVRVRHDVEFDHTQVKVDLGIMDADWADFSEKAKELASKTISKAQAARALVSVLGDVEVFDHDLKASAGDVLPALVNQKGKMQVVRCLELFGGVGLGSELESADGTAWGLVNAFTEFVDHERGRLQSRRLDKAWFGRQADMKAKVVDAALAI